VKQLGCSGNAAFVRKVRICGVFLFSTVNGFLYKKEKKHICSLVMFVAQLTAAANWNNGTSELDCENRSKIDFECLLAPPSS